MTRPPCPWLSRDDTGRPSCEHGPAYRDSGNWTCREGKRQRQLRYRRTEKGAQARHRENTSDASKSSKALYALTRVRVS